MKELTKEITEKFYNLFGIGIFEFIYPIIGFDTIRFDDYLINKYGDYMDGKTSMKMFINKKYGKEAMELIEKLIHWNCNIK